MALPSLLDLISQSTGRSPREQSRAALVTASHEIEDRYDATAKGTSVIFGGFQRARFFGQDQDRWAGFRRRSALAVVAFGSATEGRDEVNGLHVLRVGRQDPFWRDWLCLSYGGDQGSAVLIARDVETDPDRDPVARRRCIGLMSHDPRIAHAATVWVGAYLRGHEPALAREWSRAVSQLPEGPHVRRPRRTSSGRRR